MKNENLLSDYYYKVKYMGKWRLGHVIENEGHKYFYILDEGINTSVKDIFLEKFYPIFRIDSETGEVFNEFTDVTFIDKSWF